MPPIISYDYTSTLKKMCSLKMQKNKVSIANMFNEKVEQKTEKASAEYPKNQIYCFFKDLMMTLR